MPLAAGFVGILPALGLLNEKQDGIPPIHLSFIPAVGWSLAVAFFGVFLSPPIRKQVVSTLLVTSLLSVTLVDNRRTTSIPFWNCNSPSYCRLTSTPSTICGG